MSEIQEYPHMLYRDGDTTAEYKIVASAEEEAAAAKDGFVRAGEAKPAKKAAK